MIRPATVPSLPLTAWAAGVAVTFLGIGLQGAIAPLAFYPRAVLAPLAAEETVVMEEFNPPPALLSEASADTPSDDPPAEAEEVELPTLPEIAAPLTSPEMAEILPLAPRIEPPKPQPIAAPAPTLRPKPAPVSAPVAKAATNSSRGSSRTGAPATVSGTGSSGAKLLRSPKPFYPSAEQRAKHQGSVRLLVVVEANGAPSTVSVASSSGFPALDEAARDTVQRRWRWASGTAMRTYIPVTFALR
jgi:periplasmic protein TonB